MARIRMVGIAVLVGRRRSMGSGDLTALTKTKNFGSAAVKFGQYVSENCSGTS